MEDQGAVLTMIRGAGKADLTEEMVPLTVPIQEKRGKGKGIPPETLESRPAKEMQVEVAEAEEKEPEANLITSKGLVETILVVAATVVEPAEVIADNREEDP